jgi:hypothetical protein
LLVSEDRDSAPVRVIEATGKLRNGLFLRGIHVYNDRVAFEVFASRPIQMTELTDLSLRDDAGTLYKMVSPRPPELDGRGCIEFHPVLPDGALFSLSQPGWALSSYGDSEEGR